MCYLHMLTPEKTFAIGPWDPRIWHIGEVLVGRDHELGDHVLAGRRRRTNTLDFSPFWISGKLIAGSEISGMFFSCIYKTIKNIYVRV